MLISNDSEYLQQILSSKLFEIAYKKIFSSVELGEHGYQYNKHALVKLPIPSSSCFSNGQISDMLLYKFYHLTKEEINYVEAGGM